MSANAAFSAEAPLPRADQPGERPARNAPKFLFGDDFRGPPQDEEKDRAAIQAAETDAYARGVAAGRRQAELEAEQQLGHAAERLGVGLAAVLSDLDLRIAAVEEEALSFFVALAGKLAGQALAAYPLASITEAAAEAFGHLRGVPHLAIRVSDELVEEVDSLTRKMARERGYDGRIIVLGDEEIAPGDARIEWADGGILREHKNIDTAIGVALANCRPSIPT